MQTHKISQPQQYWQTNVRLTLFLLAIWFVLTFVVSFFADELNQFSFLGFPLGFYMASQGALVFYLAIVWFYARYMNQLDKAYGLDDED
jgi:putative solute:sodium symporter small subunit